MDAAAPRRSAMTKAHYATISDPAAISDLAPVSQIHIAAKAALFADACPGAGPRHARLVFQLFHE
jgi:hypothetical protein